MNLLKPIYVKRWLSETNYITYVFDTNKTNIYKSNYIVINEYIFQDNNYEDAFNKIVYYILQKDKNIELPFYFWDKDNLLYDINNIKWSGYNINPFKSRDRNSESLKEPINISNKYGLLKKTELNLVFYNDFKYDIKYYFDKTIKKPDFIKRVKELIKNEEFLVSLYNKEVKYAKLSLEEYNDVSFETNIDNIENLILLFDKLKTNEKMQIIQLINNNNAIYKLFKEHTYNNEKDLSFIFNIINVKDELLNIFYKGKTSKISISENNAIINFKYPIDNGNKIDSIIKDKKDFTDYISKYITLKTDFIETDINIRLKFMIDNIEFPTLIKKIGTYSNIFEAIIFKNEKKKNSGYYAYKRVNNILNNKFNVTSYIKSRIIVGVSEDDIVKELIIFGYTKTESVSLIKQELQIIGDIGFNNLDKNPNIIEGTYIVVKKSGSGFEIDIKNCKSFYELNNIKFWLTKIIEQTRVIEKKPVIVAIKEHTPEPQQKKSTSKSSDENLIDDDMDFDDFSKFQGGVKKLEFKNYLINRLRNADKELYQDNNKSRKCQREHQPVVLSKEELDEIKDKDYNKYFDNIIEYGSNQNIKNYYTCPRLWCPVSKIPLDESEENPKCPGDNEEPMKLNEDMKNSNKPRYAYLIKNINLPCCGKKKPIDEIKSNNTIKPSKKLDKSVSYENSMKLSNFDNDDKNYIMNKIPIPYKGRYGDIAKELYKILKPNYNNEYNKQCLSPNNINKRECILRKSLINQKDIPDKYDNIINVVAFSLGRTKEEFIKDITEKLDLITFLSLDNGNVCKDFVDLEPIIAEDNIQLYNEFLKFNKKFNKSLLDVPDASDNTKVDNYKKSRYLYIYKSYLKFIKYLSADNYPFDKTIKYLNSLVAIIYKKLIVLWDIEKIDKNIQVNMLCPYYTRFIDLYSYLDKSPKFIMIIKENNYYEPLVSKSITMKADKKDFNLEEYKIVKDILLNCTKKNNFEDYDIGLFTNKNNINVLNKLLKEESELFTFESAIINTDYTINKIILKNNTLLKFNPQSIIILPLLISEYKINNVIFYDDIIDKEFNIKIVKDIYNKFNKGFESIKELGFSIDIGEIVFDTKELIRTKLKIADEKYETFTSNIILPFNNKNAYYSYIESNDIKIKKIEKLRLLIKNKLLDSKFTDQFYNSLCKKSRKKVIKTLLSEFKSSSYDMEDIKDIQIIIEEIPLSSRKNIKNWYIKSLLFSKYDYVNELSNKIKDLGNELLFTQYTVSNKIPLAILKYHEALPNNISNIEENIDYYKLQKDIKDVDIKLPEIFNGEETALNSKWTKYKKKIWYKLRYIKNTYNETYIKGLFEYLTIKLNTNLLSYNEIQEKSNKYYLDVFNKDNYDKNKNSRIKRLFKDTHFYQIYLKELNKINKTKKSFKTLSIFFQTYFNKSSYEERSNIINNIIKNNLIKYQGDIDIYNIAKLLNISIFIIHNRSEYGKGVNVEKRAGDKDLNITTSIYKADNNIEKRPLIILYRKVEKTNISYFIIKNTETIEPFYMELQDAPDDIKNKILASFNLSDMSSTSTTSI